MPDIEKAQWQLYEKQQIISGSLSSLCFSQTFLYFVEAWQKFFVFHGRSNRVMFWSFVFFNIIIGCFFGLVIGRQGIVFYCLLSFLPAWAAVVRRLHDIGQTGAWTIIPAILGAGIVFFVREQAFSLVTLCSSLFLIFSVLLIFFLCLEGEEENKYGSVPIIG